MLSKKEQTFLFQTEVEWVGEKKGMLKTDDADSRLIVETPAAFGGKGKSWTPEHMFLGSINTCFLSTFLSFADKFKFSAKKITCPVIGQIHLMNGRLQFTQIDLYPTIICEEAIYEQVKIALEKTYKYCLISQSISTPIYYHSEIKTLSSIPAF
jgi:organic hydroperoxide reductase OsmC/OhrA